MKKLLTAIVFAVALDAYPQGIVNFYNDGSTLIGIGNSGSWTNLPPNNGEYLLLRPIVCAGRHNRHDTVPFLWGLRDEHSDCRTNSRRVGGGVQFKLASGDDQELLRCGLVSGRRSGLEPLVALVPPIRELLWVLHGRKRYGGRHRSGLGGTRSSAAAVQQNHD